MASDGAARAGSATARRRGWTAGAIVVALVLLAWWLPAAVALPVGVGWGLVLAAVLVAAWPAASRWWFWPPEDRRAAAASVAVGLALAVPVAVAAVVLGVAAVLAVTVPDSGLATSAWRVLVVDDGAWLAVLVATVALTYALRPVTPLGAAVWLSRRGLPSEPAAAAAAEVRRQRVWRTVPTVLGACVWMGTGTAYNLAIALVGTGDPASERLLAAATGSGVPGLLVLGGYLLGVVAAEATRRRPAADDGPRVAGFAARRPAGYLTPVARALPLAVAVVLLVATALVAVLAGGLGALEVAPATIAVTVLALAAGIPAVQWSVVRRRQHVRDPAGLALDDTFRSSAAHAVVGAGAAAGMLLTAGVLGTLWNLGVERGGGPIMVLLGLVSVGLTVASIAVWLGYGTSHRGARPTVTVP
jgi:hypothetical protein